MSSSVKAENVRWLMTLDEVAERFSVSVQTIRLWIHKGYLDAVRIPNKHRDLNPDNLPDRPKPKWRPAGESQSTLYVTHEALIARARVFYKTEEKKK